MNTEQGMLEIDRGKQNGQDQTDIGHRHGDGIHARIARRRLALKEDDDKAQDHVEKTDDDINDDEQNQTDRSCHRHQRVGVDERNRSQTIHHRHEEEITGILIGTIDPHFGISIRTRHRTDLVEETGFYRFHCAEHLP